MRRQTGNVLSSLRGRGARVARRLLTSARKPAILMYHRIADEDFDPFGMAVSPRNFVAQLDWLKRNRVMLPLAEFARLHRQGRLPDKAAALTFDDGYACSAQVAAPELKRFGIPATIFLSAELIEKGSEFWWDQLERIVLSCPEESVTVDDCRIDLGPATKSDGVWRAGEEPRTSRQRAYQRLWSMLRTKAPTDLDLMVQQLRRQARVPDAPRQSRRPLRPDEVRAAASSLVQFGAHGLTHSSLPDLPAAAKSREIAQSGARCEALSGERPLSFAYPFGKHDEETERLVEQSGFTCACTAAHQLVANHASCFALPRLHVGNHGAGTLSRVLTP